MPKENFLHLQHRETVVASIAATLFSAYIQKGDLSENNEDTLIDKSIALAIRLCRTHRPARQKR